MTRRRNKYTVWREPVTSLEARHVGREHLERRLRQGGAAWVNGAKPAALYLFGPRGVGKSHLIALVRDTIAGEGGSVCWVPEDIPALQSAAELLDRIGGIAAANHAGRSARTLLVVEGLDRRVGELDRAGRERLRAAWDGRRDLWVIGTGNELPTALTDREEPFFGWFDAEPVEPLSEEDGGRLLDKVVSPETRALTHWGARRRALVALSGGSPRVLVSLAETCADPVDAASVSDALLAAVDDFTPHYQGRFRDLSPQAQRIAELMAMVPTELNPTEIGAELGLSPQSAATQARRMADDGALLRREDGRSTWYRLAEPLFRYWFEYRTSPWEATRVGIASRLLEALFTAEEIVDAWWRATNPEDAAWLLPTIQTKVRPDVRRHIGEQIRALPGGATRRAALGPLLAKAMHAKQLPTILSDFARDAEVLVTATAYTTDPWLLPTLRLAERLQGTRSPRKRFAEWVRAMPVTKGSQWTLVDRLLFASLEGTWGQGRPWKLTDDEQARLAQMPFVRGHLLLRGKLSSHRPVLEPEVVGRALRSDDPDLGDILVAAIRRGSRDLAQRVLITRTEGSSARLHANPAPQLPCPVQPNLLVGWAAEHGGEPAAIRVALTWARTLADVDDDVFSGFVRSVSGSGSALRRGDIETALVALGRTRPDRLGALAAKLGGEGAQMVLFVEMLGRAHTGRLHTELQRVTDALARTP